MKQSLAAKQSLAFILVAVAAGTASAADMPMKAWPAPAPRVVSDWTGFYVGFHGGYGWAQPKITDFDLNQSNTNRTDTTLDVSEADTPLHAPKLKGALIGGHAGYNWQWGQRSVVGFEIDYSVASLKRTQTANAHIDETPLDPEVFETRTLKSKLDGLASARARVGFLVSPELLLYGTGGLAWGHTKFTDTFQALFVSVENDVLVSRASSNHFGWAAGAGAEWKLWDSGLMFRVEYLHYDFGSTSLGYDVTLNDRRKLDSFNMHVDKLSTDVARAGISYKF